jgi:ribosomal protein S13
MSLSPQQLEAVVLLGKKAKTSEVAHQLRITQRTVQRWLKDDEFATAVAEIGRQTTRLVVEATSFDLFKELEQATQSSVALLTEMIENPDIRPSDRLKAVDIVRRWGDKHRFEEAMDRDFEQTIRKLEKLMKPDTYNEMLNAMSLLYPTERLNLNEKEP